MRPARVPRYTSQSIRPSGSAAAGRGGRQITADPQRGIKGTATAGTVAFSAPLSTHPPATTPSTALRGHSSTWHPAGDQIKGSKQIKSREAAGKCAAFRPGLVNFGLLFRGGECSGCLVHTVNYC